MRKLLKGFLIAGGILIFLVSGLFIIYFYNLDMKLMVNVVAPFFEKIYDGKKKKQYL